MVIEDFSLKPNFSVNDELGKLSNAQTRELSAEFKTLELLMRTDNLNGYIFT